MPLWLKNEKLIIDSAGKPILSDYCPCLCPDEMVLRLNVAGMNISALGSCCGSGDGYSYAVTGQHDVTMSKTGQWTYCSNVILEGNGLLLVGQKTLFTASSGVLSWSAVIYVSYDCTTSAVVVSFNLIWSPGGCDSCDTAGFRFEAPALDAEFDLVGATMCNAAEAAGTFTVEVL